MSEKTKILIVDDESRMRKSLASLLKEHGFCIHMADTGKKALALIEKNSFDIVLLDLILPDMLGHQLIQYFHQKDPDTIVIMITGNASIDSAVEALKKGAYDYLKKPFEIAELITTIQNALSQKRLKSENKTIHRKLDISQKRYRYLVNNSPDTIYTLDHKGHFTFVNNSIEKMIGIKSKDIIGRHFSKIIAPNNILKYKWVMNERRTGKRAKTWNELQLLKFDRFGKPKSDILFAELQSTGMYNNTNLPTQNTFMGTYGVIRDITERKNSEAKHDKIKAQLARAEKMEAIGTLAGGVAHDLNNVLSGVLGYPELILMDLPPKDPNRNYILQIKKSGEKAAVIVKDLLTLARRGVPVSDVINLDTVICEYLASGEYYELNSRYPNITFDTSLNCKHKNIMGSCVHLSKCLMNLLSNAVEAMPLGGTICISTQTCNINSGNQNHLQMKNGEYIKLMVSDTGIGICPEDIKNIFDPFYTKKKMGRSGTGLGMTIVWTTTKDYNGYIDVQSERGKGTTFILYFPVTKKSEKIEAPFNLESIKGKAQTILIVDDIHEQREIGSNMLTALGYKIECVTTGEESIDYIKTRHADLILLDMVLGTGFDGLDTYKKIKEINPSQKVIIVSGLSETNRIKKALHLGVRQYVKKPYSMKTIGLAIKKELRVSDDPSKTRLSQMRML